MKRLVAVLVVLGAAAVLVALVGVPLYVMPAQDEPRAVDAVYVIGPPTEARMELAESMIEDGLTDTMMVSIGDSVAERDLWDAAAAACDEPQDFTVYCQMPDPFTTRGEARWMRDMVEHNEWDSVAVVTFSPHLTRTRVIMERCWDGDIAYLSSEEELDPWYWAYHYAYQSAAFIKVWLEDGC
ncbi:YdcF family protein [Demequina rhizosphaerae]|uniref:YdcF family protein n=1 Tax=Demequina rhizosphaerae TaxID=1638985 RepID=UPI0007850DD8|nr:YdcF family protein [Demequina rhizosphaerae]